MRTPRELTFDIALAKIQSLSVFLRKVVVRAQLFVNYYILKHPEGLTNDFSQQNFWCSVCRLVNGNITSNNFAQKYSPRIPHLEEMWNELNNIEAISMRVELDGLKNYAQVLSTACETIATCYNNYYVEIFENIISNYFIYMLRNAFSVSYCLE